MMAILTVALIDRYAWYAPHAETYAWVGPTGSLLQANATPPPAFTPLGQVSARCGGRAGRTDSAVIDGGPAGHTVISADDTRVGTSPLAAIWEHRGERQWPWLLT